MYKILTRKIRILTKCSANLAYVIWSEQICIEDGMSFEVILKFDDWMERIFSRIP